MSFLEKLYCAVVKAVLLFGSEIWKLSDTMLKNIDDVTVGFLQLMSGKKDRRQKGRYLWGLTSDSGLNKIGAQPLQTYIERNQAAVAELVC